MESETWQPGKVIVNKIKTNHTYLATTNYWATKEDKQPKQINQLKEMQPIVTSKTNKWTRRNERRQIMKLVIDSGATQILYRKK
jgi:hypothetical protein